MEFSGISTAPALGSISGPPMRERLRDRRPGTSTPHPRVPSRLLRSFAGATLLGLFAVLSVLGCARKDEGPELLQVDHVIRHGAVGAHVARSQPDQSVVGLGYRGHEEVRLARVEAALDEVSIAIFENDVGERVQQKLAML